MTGTFSRENNCLVIERKCSLNSDQHKDVFIIRKSQLLVHFCVPFTFTVFRGDIFKCCAIHAALFQCKKLRLRCLSRREIMTSTFEEKKKEKRIHKLMSANRQ